MSYPQQGNLLSFFVPVMAVAGSSTLPLATIDIGAASATHGEYICVRSCTVKELLFAVTLEAVSGTTAPPTVVFVKRPTPFSATSEAAIGTLTIPSGTAVGKVVYKLVTPVNLAVGESIQIKWTIGTGTPTGMGNADLMAELKPEIEGNNADMIASV